MVENTLYGVSPLAERIRFDRWGFLAFAFAGSAGIIASKVYDIDPIYVAIGAVFVMGLYASLIAWILTTKLPPDQAGDNCYYLGLIFTLSSLAYAIFTFDPNDTAATIVQGFGIALATTIWGLILRVTFSQSRIDMADIEENARLELSQTAGHLKAELSQIVVSMNDFGRQTRQSLSETQEQANELVATVVDHGVRGIEALTKTAASGLGEYFTELGINSKKLSVAATRVVTALEGQAASLEKLNAATDGTATRLEGVSQVAETASTMLAALADQVRSAAGIHDTIRASVEAMKQSVDHQASTINAVDASLATFQKTAIDQLYALEKAPGAAVTSASTALSDAANRVRGELDQLVTTHRVALQGVSDQIEAANRTVREGNSALEIDLSKSRENVSKVHTALVDMTNTLATTVELRAAL